MMVSFGLLGLLIGALVNHLATNLPMGPKAAFTACTCCGRKRPWWHSISLVAVVDNGGKCSTCGGKIPLRYSLVEIGMTVVYAGLWILFGASVKLPLYLVYFAILALVVVTDLEHKLIFDVVIYPSIILAVLCAPITPELGWGRALVGGTICFGFYFLMWLMGRVFFGNGAFGFGDVKLALFVGLITGFPVVVQTLVITAVVGAVIGIVLLLSGKSARYVVAYGPFLITGTVVALVWNNLVL